ncbi:hypothetical protein JRO89_XS06G0000400 [Xanthoceras sorbifolium]|uniref:Uncharacterized protein n=1 Tax=Xanthoceras sorbifolium TaxID=99658 RepID=A0ABQ8HW12_9ROSI|nr:hypothetical protein JRO89_XS06G0000400 [Xanthoceras sorbifolium]
MTCTEDAATLDGAEDGEAPVDEDYKGTMIVKELEEKFEILSQQFEERIQELFHQSVETQELLCMIGERLGRMKANNVGQQQPIHRNQFPIGLRPQQAEGALVQPRNIRIAFPIFSRDNPSGWVFRCEQYQRVTTLTEVELLSLATVHLEGDATRFGSLEEANAGGTLSKLWQIGTVKDYQLQFESYDIVLGAEWLQSLGAIL